MSELFRQIVHRKLWETPKVRAWVVRQHGNRFRIIYSPETLKQAVKRAERKSKTVHIDALDTLKFDALNFTATMSFNGPISEPYPNPEDAELSTHSYVQHGFKISVRKLPISKAQPIEEMSQKLGIPTPEMIFGDNFVRIEHLATGWTLEFNAFDALDRVDKTDKTMLQVAHSKEWSTSREARHEDIKEVVKPFDWSYSTDYKGTVKPVEKNFVLDTEEIPIELLKRRDPILFYDEVVLYESELDDNGISMFSCKVRVMPERMFLLCRLFMRIDNVLFRIRDTRIYVDFQKGKVIRDYTDSQDPSTNVKSNLLRRGMLPNDLNVAIRDPNEVLKVLPVVGHSLESVTLI